MKSLFLLISITFSFYFFVKFWNKTGLNKAGIDLMLLQGEMRPEWKRQCLEPGWSGDQPYHIRHMALTFRQVNCPAISSLWDSWSALTLRSPNMEVLGGVSSTNILQPPRNTPNPWRHHGKFYNPLLQYSVAGEYCSYVLEYFSGPNVII